MDLFMKKGDASHPRTEGNCQWEFQDPIYWRYLPYIRPIVQAYVRGYPGIPIEIATRHS